MKYLKTAEILQDKRLEPLFHLIKSVLITNHIPMKEDVIVNEVAKTIDMLFYANNIISFS